MLLPYYSVLFSGGVLGVYTWGAKEAHTRGFSVPLKRGGERHIYPSSTCSRFISE